MCGIAGIVSVDPAKASETRLRAMTDAIAHRGPEGEGFWTGAGGRVGLGHRRLAVLDLSETGRQPMGYGAPNGGPAERPNGGATERYIITYNGEIYNYLELRAQLQTQGYRFRSTSDTEVLLALYDAKGVSCLELLDGMFAFALYDTVEETLFCARDRFGEKPFYYAYAPGRSFLFGSEMKALWAAGVPREPNGAMAYNYLSFGLLQNAGDRSETFFEGVSRLENGHFLLVDREVRVKKYAWWQLKNAPDEGRMDDARSAEIFKSLMERSVRRRLRSDVRVGSSLSGGLDSSLILHLIRRAGEERTGRDGEAIPVFSARFPGFALDEGPYIQAAAEREGAERHDCYPDGSDCWAKLDKVFHHQEEPFGSAGIYAQYKVMETAKDAGVTVLLDGQGADEALGGYPRYQPAGMRAFLQRAGWLRRAKIADADRRQWIDPLFQRDFAAAYRSEVYLPAEQGPGLNDALRYDLTLGGLSDLLRYCDRNAMAHGREVRLPFLDHELVHFLLMLPARAKVRAGVTKFLMRVAFADALLVRTDKIGFEPPQRSWMTEAAGVERMREGAQALVRAGVLSKRYGDRTPVAHDAYQVRGGAWAILMTSMIYGK